MKRFAIALLTLSLFATAAPSADAAWWLGKFLGRSAPARVAHRHTSHSVTRTRSVSRSVASTGGCPGGVCPR